MACKGQGSKSPQLHHHFSGEEVQVGPSLAQAARTTLIGHAVYGDVSFARRVTWRMILDNSPSEAPENTPVYGARPRSPRTIDCASSPDARGSWK